MANHMANHMVNHMADDRRLRSRSPRGAGRVEGRRAYDPWFSNEIPPASSMGENKVGYYYDPWFCNEIPPASSMGENKVG
jgi:hypothetical protein